MHLHWNGKSIECECIHRDCQKIDMVNIKYCILVLQYRVVSIITKFIRFNTTPNEMSMQNSHVLVRCTYVLYGDGHGHTGTHTSSNGERTVWKRSAKLYTEWLTSCNYCIFDDSMCIVCSFTFHYLLFNVHPSFTLRSFSHFLLSVPLTHIMKSS